ncbi:hypothetical protein BDV29DRAFT_157986 [Aspergillus leporis]|uniref:Uncharacterized protein n=1 Tax=Aspergillus leporis TaxID=41062 RepID=A0A5N5X147_9EURO|nr:hypothetical protein BDV29DRAFT_157986 [Aspergillus leporis]
MDAKEQIQKIYLNPSEGALLHLERFNDALSRAIASIIDRWWSDEESFPQRMTLGSVQEALLRWVARASEAKLLPGFMTRKGIWRPDFLLGSSSRVEINGYMICKINARFLFELLPMAVYTHQAMNKLCKPHKGCVQPR